MLRVSASRAAANSPFEEGGATEELSRARATPPMEQNATEELPTRFSNVTPRRRGRKSSGPLYSAGGTATQSHVPFDPFCTRRRRRAARRRGLLARGRRRPRPRWHAGPRGCDAAALRRRRRRRCARRRDAAARRDEPVGRHAAAADAGARRRRRRELQWPAGSQATHLPPATPAWPARRRPTWRRSLDRPRPTARRRRQGSLRSPGGSPTQVKMDHSRSKWRTAASRRRRAPPALEPTARRAAAAPPRAAAPSPRAEAMAQKHRSSRRRSTRCERSSLNACTRKTRRWKS